MTEEEIKKLWCPHTRMLARNDVGEIIGNVASFNRQPQPTGFCLGGNCAWFRRMYNSIGEFTGHVYCGPAGRPEEYSITDDELRTGKTEIISSSGQGKAARRRTQRSH